MAIPRLREKNACPSAERTVLKVTLLQSGTSIYRSPSEAPGMVRARTSRIMRITNKAGIPTLLNFSIPPSTPFTMMKQVMAIKMAPKRMAVKGKKVSPVAAL